MENENSAFVINFNPTINIQIDGSKQEHLQENLEISFNGIKDGLLICVAAAEKRLAELQQENKVIQFFMTMN
jgi:hypothetical protein